MECLGIFKPLGLQNCLSLVIGCCCACNGPKIFGSTMRHLPNKPLSLSTVVRVVPSSTPYRPRSPANQRAAWASSVARSVFAAHRGLCAQSWPRTLVEHPVREGCPSHLVLPNANKSDSLRSKNFLAPPPDEQAAWCSIGALIVSADVDLASLRCWWRNDIHIQKKAVARNDQA